MTQEVDILKNLSSDDSSEIREAAFTAGRDGIKSAVPALVKLLESRNLGVQEAAEYALRQIRGPEVVNALIPLLRSDEAPLRNMSMDILREIGKDSIAPLKSLLVDDDPDIRIFISDILGSTEDISAMEGLCEALLRDPEVNVRYQAAMSLGNLGFPAAATALNQALQDEEWVQFAVIESLTKIRSESSIMAMIKALDKATDLVASMIVEALGEFGNIKAVPLLTKKLADSSTPLRNKILQSVIKILSDSALNLYLEQDKEKFKTYLLDALHDEDVDVQDAAAKGLKFVGGEEGSAAILKLALALNPDLEHDRLSLMITTLIGIGRSEALEKALRGNDEHAAKLAVEVLARLNDQPSIDLLTTEFWNKDRNTQRSIAAYLVDISDPDDADFFAQILNKHTDGDIIKSALYFFVKNPHPVKAKDKIWEFLDHRYDDIRAFALEAAIAIGGSETAEFFKERLNSQDETNRAMSIAALGRIDIDTYWEDIRDGLKDDSPVVRMSALKILGAKHPIPPIYATAMLETLNDSDKDVRLTLIEVLGNETSPEYIDTFISAMQDEDDWVKARAVESLGKLGMQEVVPALTTMLDAENPLVAIKAIEALAQIGGEAAFSALFAVLDAGNPDLQGPAEEALAFMNDSDGGGY